ncbi:hypothetical protein [Streptomyces sp. NBC_00459]|uniref:hypothetical protein n=1 Tax=Streptomyces sp. NBC_00459 TaxID=2975749 RepID=UPI002E1863CA
MAPHPVIHVFNAFYVFCVFYALYGRSCASTCSIPTMHSSAYRAADHPPGTNSRTHRTRTDTRLNRGFQAPWASFVAPIT